jgi:hypothetical protein
LHAARRERRNKSTTDATDEYTVDVWNDGQSGWAVVFHTSGDPDRYLAGWVPREREAEADKWIEFLNAEIANRCK